MEKIKFLTADALRGKSESERLDAIQAEATVRYDGDIDRQPVYYESGRVSITLNLLKYENGMLAWRVISSDRADAQFSTSSVLAAFDIFRVFVHARSRFNPQKVFVHKPTCQFLTGRIEEFVAFDWRKEEM